MREDDRIDPVCRDREVLPVALAPFLRSLKEPAVDEHLKTAVARGISSIDEMFRASHGPCRAKKLDVSQTVSLIPESVGEKAYRTCSLWTTVSP